MTTTRVPTAALLRRIATQVRRRAETVAPALGIPPSLEDFCLVASVGLQHALEAHGLHARLVGGVVSYRNHAWVETHLYGGLAVVDITATQFGRRWPVVVLALPGTKRHAAYRMVIDGDAVLDAAVAKSQALLRAAPARWWATDHDPSFTPATVSIAHILAKDRGLAEELLQP